MLSGEMRNRLLHTLLMHHIALIMPATASQSWDFAAAESALQGYLDKKRAAKCAEKFILAIASYRYSGLAEPNHADLSHGRDWLKSSTKAMIQQHVIGLSWRDVAEAAGQAQIGASEQEKMLLKHFIEYLGFFRYRMFGGLKLDSLQLPPPFVIHWRSATGFYHFDQLLAPPNFAFGSTTPNTLLGRNP